MDRRVILVLGVLAGAALLGAALWSLVDDASIDGAPSAESPAPADAAPPAPEEPRAVRASRREPATAPEPLPPPVPTGSLEVVARSHHGRAKVRAALLLPTGETVAAEEGESSSAIRFPRVPAQVPLVLRLSAPGHLTGLCCDVVVPRDGTLRKEAKLVPAPRVEVRVRGLSDQEGGPFVAELLRGDDSIAAVTADSRLEFEPTLLGSLRLRLVRPDGIVLWESTLDVGPGDAEARFEYEIPPPQFVWFSVVDATGRPAGGVELASVSTATLETKAWTDRHGQARLARPIGAAAFLAVARGRDGSFASVDVGPAVAQPIPLVLGDSMTLTGDVVDPGNRAIAGARVEISVRPFAQPAVAVSVESGLFESPPLPGGLASVRVTCEGYEPWQSEKPVEIRARVGAKIRARLVPSPRGAVVVTVSDDTGAPVADAEVILHPSRLTARTRADGTCRVEGAPADTEQVVHARRRGFRARADGAPAVGVLRDRAVAASVTLRRAGAPPAEAAETVRTMSVLGRFLDASSEPVPGVRVESGGVAAFSVPDGRWRLNGVRLSQDGSPADVVVAPGPGLFDRVRLVAHPEDAPARDYGDIRLRRRPYALVELPPAPQRLAARGSDKTKTPTSSNPPGVFWLSTNQPDTLLGANRGPFEPSLCVSYDGTWLVLPPADAWRTDGRGEVFVAYDTGRGLASAAAKWTLRPDESARLRPTFPAGAEMLSAEMKAVLREARDGLLSQVECATLFDPRAQHVPTGNPQPPVDPFAALAAWRSFRVTRNDLAWAVAPGRWSLSTESKSVACLVPSWFDPRRN